MSIIDALKTLSGNLATLSKPLQPYWEALPKISTDMAGPYLQPVLQGINITLPTAGPSSGSFQHVHLPRNLLNNTLNVFIYNNLYYLLEGVVFYNFINQLMEVSEVNPSVRQFVFALSSGVMIGRMLEKALYNAILCNLLASQTKIVSPSKILKCPHEVKLSKSLLEGMLYDVTTLLSIELLSLSYYQLAPTPSSTVLEIGASTSFFCLRAVYYGQAIALLYLQHSQVCIPCSYQWLSEHNAFCFSIGASMLLTKKLLLTGLDFSAMAVGLQPVSNLFVDDAILSALWGLTMLNSQFKSYRLTEERIRVDLTWLIRVLVDFAIKQLSPLIKAVLEQKKQGTLLQQLQKYLHSTPGKVLRTVFFSKKLNSIDAFMHDPAMQAAIIHYKSTILDSLGYLKILQDDIYNRQTVKEVVSFLIGFDRMKHYNPKQYLPKILINFFDRLLLDNTFDAGFREQVKAYVTSATVDDLSHVDLEACYLWIEKRRKACSLPSTPLTNSTYNRNMPLSIEEYKQLQQKNRHVEQAPSIERKRKVSPFYNNADL